VERSGPPQGPAPGQPARASVGEILAGVESGPRQRFLELAQALESWPGVTESTDHHVGEWSPVFAVNGRQVLHVHFHKPHLISASLNVPGRLGQAALGAPGLTPRLRQRIEREWGAGETFAEFRINTAEEGRSVLAAARAIYAELTGQPASSLAP
jgi:hypothetical protein